MIVEKWQDWEMQVRVLHFETPKMFVITRQTRVLDSNFEFQIIKVYADINPMYVEKRQF